MEMESDVSWAEMKSRSDADNYDKGALVSAEERSIAGASVSYLASFCLRLRVICNFFSLA